MKVGTIKDADGSAYVEMGNTTVLATVYIHLFKFSFGPKQSSVSTLSDSFSPIKCTVHQSAFASTIRKVHRATEDSFMEMAIIVKNTFAPLIINTTFPDSEIIINIELISLDGGQLCCALNAACLALINAGIPMRDVLVSINVGLVEDVPILGKEIVQT